MADEPEEPPSGNTNKFAKNDELRRILGDVYTFVRSRDINKAISEFSFDHYLAEAKTKIKGSGRAIRDASGKSVETRHTQLEALSRLEADFNKSLDELNKAADQLDKEAAESAETTDA